MSKIFYALALLVLLAGSAIAGDAEASTGTLSGGVSFSTSANLTSQQAGASLFFRSVTFGENLADDLVWFKSVEVSETAQSGAATRTADGIVGVATCVSGLTPPTTFVGYFESSTDASYDATSGLTSISGSRVAAGVATVYASVAEMDPNNNVVNTVALSTATYGDASVGVDSTGHLHYAVWTASSVSLSTFSFNVKFAVAVSEIAGVLSVGGAPITPKSVEAVLEIHDIVYTTPGNHVRLSVYTAAASANSTFSVMTDDTILSGSGDSQVFIHFSGQAVINGTYSGEVTLGGITETTTSTHHITDLGNGLLQDLLTANTANHIDVRLVTIDFPAYAVNVSYDPATGFDGTLYDGGSSSDAHALVTPIALIFFAAIMLVFL